MNYLLPLLAVIVGLFGLPAPAQAQQTPTFTHSAVSLRVGAVPTMNESADGLAPYVEAQSKVNLGETPFGLALYGGLSYERSEMSRLSTIVCIKGPCPHLGSQGRRTYLDLATGLRVGVFPRHGPVDAFVGVVPHLLRRTTESERVEEERWVRYSTVETGVSVQVPLTRRVSISAGVRGDFLLHTNAEGLSDSDDLLELGRYVLHAGVQYEL